MTISIIPSIKQYIYFLAISLVITLNNVYSCSRIYQFPSLFDSTEFIFTGKVISHIGPFKSTELNKTYWAILVQPLMVIYIPETPQKYFEVIPYSLGADCSLTTMEESTFKNQYPIGSELRIVGKRTKYFSELLQKENIRLDVSPYNDFVLSINIPYLHKLYTTSASIYDYGNMEQDMLKEFRNSISKLTESEKSKVYLSFQNLFHFELRKDLYRLWASSNDTSKTEIIRRISHIPKYPTHQLIDMIGRNIDDPQNKKDLMNQVEIKMEVK